MANFAVLKHVPVGCNVASKYLTNTSNQDFQCAKNALSVVTCHIGVAGAEPLAILLLVHKLASNRASNGESQGFKNCF
jgi:hypothetical protein